MNKSGADNMSEARKRYALQTALGVKGLNYLESRISWTWDKNGKDPIPQIKIEKDLFGNRPDKDREKLLKHVRLVVSYSKSDYNAYDRLNEQHKMIVTFEEIMKRVEQNRRLRNKEFSIVGIDFTGSDEMVRPEVYAQLVRYARRRNKLKFHQFTYHVGEDFYDLMDGLRSIDEVLQYLKWDKKCRISHALALETNVYHYYQSRGWCVIAPKQVLLDNLVWYVTMANGRSPFAIRKIQRETLVGQIETLYHEIGYTEAFDLIKYAQSMRLRGDHPLGAGRENGLSLFAKTALDDDPSLDAIRNDTEVKALFDDYYSDKTIMQAGQELTFWKMPKFVVNGMKLLQSYLIEEIKKRKISIECCPTSNLQIGGFERYIDLPLLKFIDKLPDNKISINTDDKGILATSIENEYALIYAAMEKSRKYSARKNQIIERIRRDSVRSMFKVV